MSFSRSATVCLALLSLHAGLTAAPPGATSPHHIPPSLGGVDAPFSDDFDAYTPGSGIAGQGPWTLWDPNAMDAWVDDQLSHSAPNSLRLEPASDVVVAMDVLGGQWRLTMQTWFPSSSFGIAYVIGLNTYAFPAGPNHWSMDIQFNGGTQTLGLWPDPSPPPPLPLLTDQWVELRVEIDLDSDTYSAWYGGTQFVVDRPWSTGWSVGGMPRIQAFDFYSDTSNGVSGFRIDNIVFEQLGSACYADCDDNQTLNIDDFLCFINAFAQNDPYADCDGNMTFNIDDFLCFINEFAQGCP